MAQPVATQNFLIHDANGKPQVIKVVHTTTPSGKSSWQPAHTARTSSSIIKTTGGASASANANTVRQLYNDDDSDSGSNSYIPHKARPGPLPSPQSSYKIVRPQSQPRVYHMQSNSENDSSHMASESSSRLSMGAKRMAARPTTTPYKRVSPDVDVNQVEMSFSGKRRRGEKGSKGLRHFSMKVCQKVRQKGKTTYNEVADELVAEFTGTAIHPGMEQSYDQKNIRRRVYDALNVLMAMNIISKEKKEIRWLGLPSGYPKIKAPDPTNTAVRDVISKRIAQKKKTLQNLILQQIAFKNLMQRNKENEMTKGPPAPGAVIQLPMLVVSTNQNTTVNCSVSNDRKEYFFSFDDVFEIKDEGHVLQGMGMMMGLNTGNATPEDLISAKTIIPRAVHPYLEEMVHQNVQNVEASGSASLYAAGEEEDDEGTVYLEEEEERDDSATDDDTEGH